MTYKQDRWNLYANYTYVDATFQNALTLQSPFNPFADANGNIFVVPAIHLTGIPNFRFKLGGEYQVTKPWKVGADLNVVGSQWLVGDESNQNPKVPAYWVVNLHSSYKITDNIEVFGLVRNLFDQHYYVLGTFFDVTSFPYLGLTDPRTFVPGMPFAGYLGVRGTLPTIGPAFAADAAPPVVTKAGPAPGRHRRTPVNWTGIYLGLNGGFTFGASNWTDSVTGCRPAISAPPVLSSAERSAPTIRSARIVLGVEADGDWADASGFGTFTASALCAGGCLHRPAPGSAPCAAAPAMRSIVSLSTAPAAPPSATCARIFTNNPVSAATEAGWTAGAGVEVALGRNWSAKAEYLFVKLADGSCTADCAIADANGPCDHSERRRQSFNESIVRGGINYKFAW